MFWFFVIVFGLIFIGAVVAEANKSPEKRAEGLYGPINPHMVCPHCNATGSIRTKKTTQKKGVSGGKATAALLTGGVSLLATGLSRKENNTQAHCTKCQNTWFF